MMEINTISIEDLLKTVGSYKIIGGGPKNVTNISTIREGKAGTFTWLNQSRRDKAQLISESNAGFVVMHEEELFEPKLNQLFIKVSNPKLVYVKALSSLLKFDRPALIHPSAIVSPEATIHQRVCIGPFCVIEKCEIGEGTVVESHCKIGNGTRIGKRVSIASGVIIGSDGFGYVEDDDGSKIRFPHIGEVIIGDDVEIGANTCIDRGTLGNTVIKEGAKIDNLVHIAHNVVIGRNAAIIANAMIGGSTEIGDNAWVAPSATIRDAVIIGSSSMIGLGSLVTKSIPDNQVWAGFPAKFIRENE